MTSGAEGGRRVLRHRDFRLFLTSRFLWGIALQMQAIALAWRVYDVTRDPLALGLIGLFAFAPALPLSFVAGAVADRFDRRRVLAFTYALMALGLAGFITLSGATTAWPAYGLVVVVGAARAFSNPASQALLANLVPREEFPAAAAWSNTVNQTGVILGPSLGGLLYPVGAMAPFSVALCAAIAAFALNMAMAPPSAALGGRPPITLAVFVAGYRFIWSAPAILGAITLDLVAVLLGGATALLPVYASDVFHAGPWGLGLLRSSPAIGSLVAAFILTRAPLTRHAGRVMFGAVIVYGCATIAFALAANIWLGMACLAVLGAADIVSVVVRQSLIQIDTPDEMRGRVVAVHNILTSASNNLGDFESGALASLIGAGPTIISGGACAIVASMTWMRLFPALRNRDDLSRGEPTR
jgi:MFS family permease